MRGQRRSGIWASAMHHVKNAIRQTRLAYDLAKHVSRHWRELARLRDRRISNRDSRRDFPAQQIKGKIPRRYKSSDTAWLSQRVVEGDIVGDMRFGFGVENCSREESEVGDCTGNVQGAC